MAIDKKAHVDADPPGWERVPAGQTVQPGEPTVVRNGVTFRWASGKPYYNAKDNMDVFINRRGLRVDIAPTILDRFGLDLSRLSPPLDGHPLTKPYESPRW